MKAVSGRLLRGDESRAVRAISLDSRQMEGDDLFVPLVGEKVDAHPLYLPGLVPGAAAVFTSAHETKEDVELELERFASGGGNREAIDSCAWIGVNDTRKALQALGGVAQKPDSTFRWWE